MSFGYSVSSTSCARAGGERLKVWLGDAIFLRPQGIKGNLGLIQGCGESNIVIISFPINGIIISDIF